MSISDPRVVSMRLLLYTHPFAPQVGGQETIVMQLAQGLVRHASSAQSGKLELTLITSAPANGMNDVGFGFQILRRPKFSTILREIREADVIHLAGPLFFPMILGLALRKAVVIEHHGFQAICPNGQLFLEPDQKPCPGHFMARRFSKCIRCNSAHGKLRSRAMLLLTFPRRWLCQRVSVNILPTEWLGTLLKLHRMRTIVHGLPATGALPARDFGPEIPTFMFLGRLVTSKGARVLIEAAQQVKATGAKFRVVIIGQGPDRVTLEKLVQDRDLEDWVQFRGYVPAGELQENLAKATAIVMPSIAGEVFGLSAAENMQYGRLLIVSDIGALAEVVGDAGMKFAPGDAAGLARCMESAIANPSFGDELRLRASRRIAQFFGLDQMIRDHLRCYEELCEH
jgi:glycosyltransferase involved in cell wall biosynthesis